METVLKTIAGVSVVSAMLLFSGCQNEDSTTCRMDTQIAIDQGEWDKAISLLDGECQDAFSQSDRAFNLATVYMGKAGYGVSEVITMVLDTNDSQDAFSAYARSVTKDISEDSLGLLAQAKSYYIQAIAGDANATIDDVCTQERIDQDTRARNTCLYLGFNETLRTTATLTYMTNDTQQLLDAIDGEGATPLDMQASIDALAWAVGTTPPNNSEITSQDVTIKDQQYKHLEVVLNGETFYRLASSDAPSTTATTIVTDGYCDVNGTKDPCIGIENEDGSIDTTKVAARGCYACPVIVDGTKPQAMTDTLVDALNNSLDLVLVSTSDEDIKQSIEDFINNIDGSSDGKITVDEILDYLNK